MATAVVLSLVAGVIYTPYSFLMYPKNGWAGFCIPEFKQLSPEQKRKNFFVDYVAEGVRKWDKNNDFFRNQEIAISKYNLADKEELIKLMIQSDPSKSFEENFGVVAKSTARQYRYHGDRRYDKAELIGESMRSLLTQDRKLDTAYLRKLPDNYTLIMGDISGHGAISTIIPLSLIKPVDHSHFGLAYYHIRKSCCDSESIDTYITSQPLSEAKLAKAKLKDPLHGLRFDQIDGVKFTDISIDDAYDDMKFYTPEQVHLYHTRMEVGEFRNEFYNSLGPTPSRWLHETTACGTRTSTKAARIR